MREERLERRQLRALGREAARGAHQLIEVLGARFAALGLFAAVMLDETARLQHLVHLLVQHQGAGLSGEAFDERQEAVDGAARLRAQGPARATAGRGRLPQRAAGSPGVLAQHIEALRPHAARRQVHHALEGGIIVAVGNESQVGERVLDFRALEEPQAAVHAVRHARRQKRLFEHARLCIGAVEDCDLAPHPPARHPLTDAVGDELRLVALVEGRVEADRLAARTAGPQLLAEAAGVVGDQAVGGFENDRGGAVVLLEPEKLRLRVIAAELLQVLDLCAAPAVYGVMRNEAVGNEIVRTVDVQIIDIAGEVFMFDAFHYIETRGFCCQHHSGPNRGGGNEGQRAAEHVSLQDIAPVQLVADASRDLHQLTEVAPHCFETPALADTLDGSHAEAQGLQCASVSGTHPPDRDSVHGGQAAPVSAQSDYDVAAAGIAAPGRVVRSVWV